MVDAAEALREKAKDYELRALAQEERIGVEPDARFMASLWTCVAIALSEVAEVLEAA